MSATSRAFPRKHGEGGHLFAAHLNSTCGHHGARIPGKQRAGAQQVIDLAHALRESLVSSSLGTGRWLARCWFQDSSLRVFLSLAHNSLAHNAESVMQYTIRQNRNRSGGALLAGRAAASRSGAA